MYPCKGNLNQLTIGLLLLVVFRGPLGVFHRLPEVHRPQADKHCCKGKKAQV